jgi:hypothetical protein
MDGAAAVGSFVGQAFSLRRASARLGSLAFCAAQCGNCSITEPACLRARLCRCTQLLQSRDRKEAGSGHRFGLNFAVRSADSLRRCRVVGHASACPGKHAGRIPARRASASLQTGQPSLTMEFRCLNRQASCRNARETRQTSKGPAEAGRRLNACPTQCTAGVPIMESA